MLKENGDLPKNQAFDDDEDKDDAFSQMKKPSGNLGTGKSKTRFLITSVEILPDLARDGKLDPVIGREKRLREYLKFFPEERKTILF
jgi:ATP-dependent Clp protease ATP-binding subunit ClpC